MKKKKKILSKIQKCLLYPWRRSSQMINASDLFSMCGYWKHKIKLPQTEEVEYFIFLLNAEIVQSIDDQSNVNYHKILHLATGKSNHLFCKDLQDFVYFPYDIQVIFMHIFGNLVSFKINDIFLDNLCEFLDGYFFS